MMNDKSEKATSNQRPVTRNEKQMLNSVFFWFLVTGYWFLLAANAFAAVSRVEFYRDGTKIGEDTAAPYTFSVDTTGVPNGSHTFSAKAYDSAGNVTTDAFIATCSSTGDYLWSEQCGGSGSDLGLGLQIDKSGYRVLTGYFFGNSTCAGQTVTSAGSSDIFLIRRK